MLGHRMGPAFALTALAALGAPQGPVAGARPAPSPTAAAAARTGAVLPGIDVLLAEGGGPLRGLRVGLITNRTGRTRSGESSIDALYASPDVKLVALFSPEHGIRGTARPGQSVASGRDPKTGLPIHSLYGKTEQPTAAMLKGLDALAFDIQSVGTRYYTYVWTMALAMKAAARAHLKFVVLDRPNPITGAHVQGNVLDPAHASFVGLYPVPMRYGLTPGELARWLNGEFHMGVDLAVVPVKGWRRGMWYDQTGIPWIAPSPNMPSLESATDYPGTCLFEGTNLSVGRGTPIAFQQIGAPWVDGPRLARELNERRLPGVRFQAVTFTPAHPGDGKYDGVRVRGVRFVITDRDAYDPTVASVAALVALHRMYPQQLTFRASHFDRLAGGTRLRRRILAGDDVSAITGPWARAVAAFEASARKYMIYPTK